MTMFRVGGGGGENVTAEVTLQKQLLDEMESLYKGKTTGADATAEDILEGKKAYVGRNLITGTYPDVAPEVEAQTPIVQGIHDFITSIVGLPKGANAKAENIEKGYTAYVGQQLITGTLDPEALKNGKYVWKRYEFVDVNISMQLKTASTTPVLSVDSVDIDLTTVGSDFLVGFKTTYHYQDADVPIDFRNGYAILNNEEATQYPYVFNPSEKTITMQKWNLTGISLTFATAQHRGKVQKDFSVSDNESAYPDGGEQNGYWYEKYKSPLEQQGIKAAVSTFVLGSNQVAPYVEHSLGVIPKAVVVFGDVDYTNTLYVSRYSCVFDDDGIGSASVYEYRTGNGETILSYATNAKTANATKVQLYTQAMFQGGKEYTLIVMA